jgi:uncharacterized protein YaaR (DUF327 family)
VKINSGLRPFGKELKISDNPANQAVQHKNFSDIMQNREEQSSKDQLRKMLQQIERQSERLAKSMTIRELRQYKLMVKKFLEDTVRQGIVLKDTKGWDRRGRGKRYKILDEIDQHLVQMADDMLEQENGRIELLHRIGEIRGLLINLIY